ncbi:MAG: transcription termination/antitermination protein NusG [Eubacterium sp.]|nr:transcription termination/antitermination protein NusG [Eubacterium sp.]
MSETEDMNLNVNAEEDEASSAPLQEEEIQESSEAKWYVAHTYSGYENKVKATIEKTIEHRHLEDQILEVRVPMEEVVEVRGGTKKRVQKKLFPGYVLLHMIMNDETWYVVRNTRGVTGFVGPGSKPVPLSAKEMIPLGIDAPAKVDIDLEVGDRIVVVGGAWKDVEGTINEINKSKQTVKIEVELFGRATPVEISFAEVEKLD